MLEKKSAEAKYEAKGERVALLVSALFMYCMNEGTWNEVAICTSSNSMEVACVFISDKYKCRAYLSFSLKEKQHMK